MTNVAPPGGRARHAHHARRAPRGLASMLLAALLASTMVQPSEALAQDLSDASRLGDVGPLAVRASVEWDEQITSTAGGATAAQYHDAVLQTFRNALEPTDVPLDDASETFVLCRVETFYDQGMIAYAVRVELLRPGEPGGAPVIVWQRSWVGTTVVGGLHHMFALGEQCAEDFLEDWTAAQRG